MQKIKDILNDILQKDISLKVSGDNKNTISDDPEGIFEDCVRQLMDNELNLYIDKKIEEIALESGISLDKLEYAPQNFKKKIYETISKIQQTINEQTSVVYDLKSVILRELVYLYNMQIGVVTRRIEKIIDYDSTVLKPLNTKQKRLELLSSSAVNKVSSENKIELAREISDAFLNRESYRIKISGKSIGIDQETLNKELKKIESLINSTLTKLFTANYSKVSETISNDLSNLQEVMNEYSTDINKSIRKWSKQGIRSIDKLMTSEKFDL